MNNLITDKIQKDDAKIPLILGITGNRDIFKNDVVTIKKKFSEIFKILINKYSSTPIILLTPLADGVDRIIAELASDEFKDNIHISVPLPLDINTYKSTFGKGILDKSVSKDIEEKFIAKSILEFETLLNKVNTQKNIYLPNTIPMIFDKEHYDSLDDDNKKEIRRKQYSLVGEYISIHSHILIAVYDKDGKAQIGGTFEVVDKKLNGTYEYFDNSKENVTNSERGIVYEMDIHRLSSKTQKRKKNLEVYKCYPDGSKLKLKKQFFNFFKNRTEKIHTQYINEINNFNKDVEQNIEIILDKAKKDISELEEKDFVKNIKLNERYLIHKNILIRRSAAELSTYYQYNKIKWFPGLPKYENMILFLIWFLIIIISIKATFLNFKYYIYLDPIILSIGALSYVLIEKFKKKKKKYEDYRAISEGLRVQIYWNIASINDSISSFYLSHQKGLVGWIRSAIRGMNIFYYPKLKANFQAEEIITEFWVSKQIKYFEGKIKKKNRRLFWFKNILLIIFLLSFIFLMGMDFFENSILENLSILKELLGNENTDGLGLTNINYFELLFTIFPLSVLGILKAKQVFDDEEKTIKSYKQSLMIFKKAKVLLAEGDIINQQKIFKNLGIEAIRENSGWVITRQEKEYEIPK